MQRAKYIAEKNILCGLIKKVSDLYNGDDVEWLRAYASDVVETNKDVLELAIACFRDVIANEPKGMVL